MPLPALADVPAFRVRLGRDMSEDEQTRAQAALEDASALIRNEAGKTWVTDDQLDEDLPDIIVTICLVAARRWWDNPSQLSSMTTGNYSETRTGVYLTDAERSMIHREVGGGGGLVSVPAVTPWSMNSNEWIEVVGQPNEPMPYSEP